MSRAQAEALLQNALQLRQTGPNTFVLGQVTFDRQQRTITLPARVNMRRFAIEYALVHVSGKDHESLLVTDVEPLQLHTVCLLLGLSPGPLTGAQGQPERFPATNAVTVEVAWDTPPGPPTRCPLAELVALKLPGSDEAGAAMSEAPWYFNGSQMIESGFAAQEEGSILSLIRDPLALLNNPRPERDNDDSYVPNALRLPPEGTPVQVILRLPAAPANSASAAPAVPAANSEREAGARLAKPPLGPVGARASYRHAGRGPALRGAVVERFTLSLGSVEGQETLIGQWLTLDAVKAGGQRFTVWLLCREYPSTDVRSASESVARYLLARGDDAAVEFVHRYTGRAVLPESGAWEYLLPRAVEGGFRDGVSASRTTLLGHTYELEEAAGGVGSPGLPASRRLELWPEMRVGVPSNTRTRDSVRRYDGSDHERVRLSRDDYHEMIRAGLNCFFVDAEQAGWIQDQPVFYWGLGGANISFPECLYQSTYVGPALYLDEPAVHTRDYIIQPRFTNDAAFRRAVTPQVMFEAFQTYFHETIRRGTPWAFRAGLRARADVDLGTMDFAQPNLYSWETMVASAAWQLTAEPRGGPGAIVFEPPGRLGSRRTLPEMNMAYGCQLPPGDPANLSDPIIGFLRGAARAADKEWGISIYGAVDRGDAPWLLTRAYDLGAKYFFFYDNAGLACVPYEECLALARHLHAHAAAHPHRDQARLLCAAEVAILLPPGYDLGHVHMGKGNLWGLGELNLERRNRHGVAYRKVMGNFFAEIERCLRLGVAFDLLWDLEGLKLTGYREIVRVREDGRIELLTGGRRSVRKAPRLPVRPEGNPPQLAVELSEATGSFPRSIIARARVIEGSAPVYFTPGANAQGIYPNAEVLWELYGPGEEDYRALLSGSGPPARVRREGTASVVEVDFRVTEPGPYRLRAATADLAGRSTVVWKAFTAER